jgi:hypothetical protein
MTAMDFRLYDNALGRFHSVDLLAEVDYSGSPYSFGFNNPVYFSDPSGLTPQGGDQEPQSGCPCDGTCVCLSTVDIQGWVRPTSTSYTIFQSADNRSVAINIQPSYGSQERSGGGGVSSLTPAGLIALNSVAIEGARMKRYNNSSFKYAMVCSVALIADDATVVGVVDDVLIPFIWAGAATMWMYDNSALLTKKAIEINRLLEKTMGPSGFTYELRINRTGEYVDVRGNVVHLNAGDIWKYGETSNGMSRYSRSTLDNMVPGGVKMFPIFLGNQIEIKVQEKIMIYGYTLMNGSLPPGNKIFR